MLATIALTAHMRWAAHMRRNHRRHARRGAPWLSPSRLILVIYYYCT